MAALRAGLPVTTLADCFQSEVQRLRTPVKVKAKGKTAYMNQIATSSALQCRKWQLIDMS